MKGRRSVLVSIVSTLAISMMVVGCSKAPNDNQIVSDIQTKISGDSGLQGKQLAVQSTNGSVTLSGVVDSDSQRDAAARYASSEPGVKQVVNNLQIAPPQQAAEVPPPPPPVQASKPAKRHKTRKPEKVSDESVTPTQVAQNTPPPAPAPAPVQTAPPPPPPPPPPQKVTIPQGTVLSVRLIDPIDSEKNQTGDSFHATLNQPLTINGDVVVPSGSDVQGHLVEVKSAGKFAGSSQVVMQLDSIKSGSSTYNVQTDQYTKQGSSRGKNTAVKTGVGAGVGAVLGGLLGGGKGAAIGAAAGGGLGAGSQAVTKSQQIKLPSETVLSFTLQAPVTVVATSKGPNSGRQPLDANANP